MSYFKSVVTQSIRVGEKLLTLERPLVMGILNVTPDSFFDGGAHNSLDDCVRHVGRLLQEGAEIIDIGAYSSRPGAPLISSQEEIYRAVPVIQRIAAAYPDTALSIDTFRADVAKACIEAGAHMINDVSGGGLDNQMFATVAALQVPYILMHMRGTPETMQQLTDYTDIVTDITVYFSERISALRALGVKDIILDPGFGFAKTMDQNYELLLRMDELHYLGAPILGGVSRKSMIYKKLGITPQEALPGTIALNTLLLERGAHILRVHDVKETKQIVDLFF